MQIWLEMSLIKQYYSALYDVVLKWTFTLRSWTNFDPYFQGFNISRKLIQIWLGVSQSDQVMEML